MQDWYGIYWFVDTEEALSISREDQTRPFLVSIPEDPKQAKNLRRAGYYSMQMFPEYYKRNPPKDSIYTVRNRIGLKAFLVERDGPGCFYCGSDDDSTFDHVVPFSRGGTWNKNNIVLCCPSCNVDKHNRTPQEWRAGVIYRRAHCRSDAERAWYDSLSTCPVMPKINYNPRTGLVEGETQ